VVWSFFFLELSHSIVEYNNHTFVNTCCLVISKFPRSFLWTNLWYRSRTWRTLWTNLWYRSRAWRTLEGFQFDKEVIAFGWDQRTWRTKGAIQWRVWFWLRHSLRSFGIVWERGRNIGKQIIFQRAHCRHYPFAYYSLLRTYWILNFNVTSLISFHFQVWIPQPLSLSLNDMIRYYCTTTFD
jgi:hypothetical protein